VQVAASVATFAQPNPTNVSSAPHVPSAVQHPARSNKPAIDTFGHVAFSVPGASSGKQSAMPTLGAVKPHVLLAVQQLVA
jgi:hypothetical protein